MAEKIRLDALLTRRGLFESRSRAAASVMAGEVRLGSDGRRAEKPGMMLGVDAEVSVDEAQRYVSRGGVKLANALDGLGLHVAGRRCLDVGASTGGFTDCLLQRGAACVVALDVAYGELAWSLRQDARVTVIERANARSISRDDLPFAPDLVVCDVSFISLTKIVDAVLGCVSDEGFDALLMIKPQFEVGRARLGKGGVVRDADDRRSALLDVASACVAAGASVLGFASSGLPGPKGNRETFIRLSDRPGLSSEEIAAAALEVEPA